MATQNNNLRNLTTPAIGTLILPKLVLPPMPEKIVKIDPEGLKSWQGQFQKNIDEYNQKLQTAINGGAT